MSAFFTDRPEGRPGLAIFLNAGDPPLDVFRELVLLLDACRVDCLELAIPFPNSPTDGPVIQESASRALANGTDREAVLGFIEEIRPELNHLKIALLADWRYSIRDVGLPDFLQRTKASGADGVLVHALPPGSATPTTRPPRLPGSRSSPPAIRARRRRSSRMRRTTRPPISTWSPPTGAAARSALLTTAP